MKGSDAVNRLLTKFEKKFPNKKLLWVRDCPHYIALNAIPKNADLSTFDGGNYRISKETGKIEGAPYPIKDTPWGKEMANGHNIKI